MNFVSNKNLRGSVARTNTSMFAVKCPRIIGMAFLPTFTVFQAKFCFKRQFVPFQMNETNSVLFNSLVKVSFFFPFYSEVNILFVITLSLIPHLSIYLSDNSFIQ